MPPENSRTKREAHDKTRAWSIPNILTCQASSCKHDRVNIPRGPPIHSIDLWHNPQQTIPIFLKLSLNTCRCVRPALLSSAWMKPACKTSCSENTSCRAFTLYIALWSAWRENPDCASSFTEKPALKLLVSFGSTPLTPWL